MRLTLLKAGLHPDPRADAGSHRFTYALLPHEGGFSADSVIRPAYELNAAVPVGAGLCPPSLFSTLDSNIVCESIKPAEDGRGYILRLYEAENSSGRVTLRFSKKPAAVQKTNLLEEFIEELSFEVDLLPVSFKAFEIVTLRIVL